MIYIQIDIIITSHKHIFNVHSLDMQKVAMSFGFRTPPRMNLNFGASDKNKKRQRQRNNNNNNKQQRYGKSGHVFSAENPNGKLFDVGKFSFGIVSGAVL